MGDARTGRDVRIGTGTDGATANPSGVLAGYLAVPASGHGRGLLVVHEGFGLGEFARGLCDRFAREGFVALAPDLYRGTYTSDPVEAVRLVRGLDLARTRADLGASLEYLRRHAAVDGAKLGVIGFCMGGQLALAAACGRSDVGAVVDCYGILPALELDYSSLRAPVLGVFAENDAFVPPEAARALEQKLRAAGVRTHVEIYLGVGHGFVNDTRPDVYAAHAAARALGEMLNCLRAELG